MQRRPLDNKIVIYAPIGKDARLIELVLSRANLHCHICNSAAEVMDEINLGAGALILVDEVLNGVLKPLTQFLNQQPAWSDLPILVLSHEGRNSPNLIEIYLKLGNVTILERPLQSFTLESAVKTALRARIRQYAMRDIDKRKDEFLAMLAHELRNPLAPVSAASDLLKFPNLNPEKVRQTSEIISRQVRHMTGLIDDLLDASRVSRGLITLDNQVLDVSIIVDICVEQVRPMFEKRRQLLILECSPDVAYIHGDQKRLVQILSNVLNNASKYTQESGEILLRVEVNESDIVFTVIDNGIGIPFEIIDHIFEMFAQAHQTPDRTQGGLGIGLALVKSLIELHNGKISANSDGPGMGSQFIMTFPRYYNFEEIPVAPIITSEHAIADSRLLIVDDNIDAATTLGIFLELSGYEVQVVHSARAALEAVNNADKIHACLLDIGLPDMDGKDLARQLRSLPITSNAKLIAITGYGQETDRLKTMEAGFDYHLVKPVEMDKLLGTLTAFK